MVSRQFLGWVLPVFVMLCLGCVAVAQAAGQENMESAVAAGAILCGNREAAIEIITILGDPDREVVVRRLLPMLASGVCREFQQGESFDVVEVEPRGIVKIRLHGQVTAYLASLPSAAQ